MKKKLVIPLLLLVILGLTWTSSMVEVHSTEPPTAGNYDRTFTFGVQHRNFQTLHTLYTSVPASLYDYYDSRKLFVDADSNYGRYVTPTAFKSIAESIQNATRNAPYSNEQFANAVLTLVRQVSYVKSSVKYPVEAMVENSGDCDVLSLLAASIMKAGGLDVVLLHYKGLNPSHMNIGVYLPNKPIYRTWWMAPTGFEYNNKTYWMAEATSRGDWKVGDRPNLLAYAKPRVIPLNDTAKSSPGQISASLDKPLLPSSISITLSSDNASLGDKERSLTISGAISPASPARSVVMYVSQTASPLKTYTTDTDQLGNYAFTWNFSSTSVYNIRTSWSDSSDYAGSDSDTLTILASNEPIAEENTSEYYMGAGPEDPVTRANSFPFQNLISQGAKELLKSNLTGTGVFLSGEFIVLNNQTAEPKNMTMTRRIIHVIRIPRTRELVTIVEEETIPIPEEPNNQLGLILRQDGENNYSASVRVLEDQYVSQITEQLDENGAPFMNASQITRINTWYKLEATMSKDATDAKLYEKNGTLLKNIAPGDDAVRSNEVGILMAYEPNAIVAFKNLRVETLDKPTPTVGEEETTPNVLNQLAPYIILLTLLVPTVATVAYFRRKKKSSKTE
jgi:hypothetical protein